MVGLCRLCASLKTPDSLMSIKDNATEICERIRKCCDLKIEMLDAMPKKICQACVHKLNESYDFYTKVQEAQKALRELFPTVSKKEISYHTEIKENLTGRSDPSTSSELEVIGVKRKKYFKKENNTAKIEGKLKSEPTKGQLRNHKKLRSHEECAIEEQLDDDTNAMLLADNESDDTGDKSYLQEVYNILGLSPTYTEDDSNLEQQLEPENIMVTFCGKENQDHSTKQERNVCKMTEEEPIEVVLQNCDDVKFEEYQTEMGQEESQDSYEVETIEFDGNLLVYNNHEKEYAEEEQERKTQSTESINSWKNIKYICCDCVYQTTCFNDFIAHAMATHSITNINHIGFKCSDCHVALNHYSEFVNHMRLQHYSALLLRCDACDNECKSFKQYKLHRDLQCPEKTAYPTVFTCSICAQVFRSHTSREIHIQNHSEDSMFKCTICPSSFATKLALNKHNLEHKPIKHLFSCDICQKLYVSQRALDEHAKKHTGETLYQCDICKKRFMSLNALERHKETHNRVKKFDCSYCPRQFRTKIEKITHERIHTGEMPLKCNQCEKRFRFRSALAAHLKTHSGVQNYACTFCERRFNDISNYKKHLRRKHVDELELLDATS